HQRERRRGERAHQARAGVGRLLDRLAVDEREAKQKQREEGNAEAERGQYQPPRDRLLEREAGDHEHAHVVRPSTRLMKTSSSERWIGTSASRRRPLATTAAATSPAHSARSIATVTRFPSTPSTSPWAASAASSASSTRSTVTR